jgi:hypothetical protein
LFEFNILFGNGLCVHSFVIELTLKVHFFFDCCVVLLAEPSKLIFKRFTCATEIKCFLPEPVTLIFEVDQSLILLCLNPLRIGFFLQVIHVFHYGGHFILEGKEEVILITFNDPLYVVFELLQIEKYKY